MIESITLLGSSSGRNAGDATLVSGIMDSVDKACGSRLLYEIPTIRPSYIVNNYKNRVKPVSMLPWHGSIKMFGIPTYQSILRTDLSLIFDAILFDRSLYNPLFNFMSTLYLILPHAKRCGKKMAFFNVGAGPVDSAMGKRMLAELAEIMDFVTVRDQDSKDLLINLGVNPDRVMLGADAALSVPPSDEQRVQEIFESIKLNPSEPFLAINVNAYIDTWARPKREPMGKAKFVDVYSSALTRLAKEIRVPILFVVTQHHDVAISSEILSKVESPEPVKLISNVDHSHYDVKAVLSRASLLCGMRLHSLILASSELTPVVGIAYQPKCEHYFKLLNLNDDYMMYFNDFTVDSLYEHILKGWNEKTRIKNILESRIPILKQEADKAAKLVAEMR